MVYPKASVADTSAVPASPNFPAIETGVLAYWKTDETFAASVENRPAGDGGGNEFVFYDGPPFANGLPHYGHLLTGYAKDVVPRYQTMRGHRVERRFGWDTHGLPAELETMREHNLETVEDIERVGIDTFNNHCRESVLKYTKEWEEYVTQQARWVDFENDYKTLNLDYMESVMWAFKQLHEKGLVYQGFYVLPYCWNDETPLSNHELRMDDDVYQDRQDLTATVTFPIVASGHALDDELLGVNMLAWTTTPWTLPTNFSLAVGPEVAYVVVDSPNGSKYMIGQERLAAYATDLGFEDVDAAEAAISATYQGAQLGALRYEPLWDYYCDTEKWGTENAWQVLVEEYVTTSDGTGIVHQASAYGEIDQESNLRAGIPTILSIDSGARFLPMFGEGPLADIAGVNVFDANTPIVRVLRASGRLVKEFTYVHSYPHCWRCRNPLIYKAVSSWFVKVTDIKDRMSELNQDINWIPENVKDGSFGTWVGNARDWAISRNRYWGSPIPVWVSDNPDYPRTDVYGSIAELEADFGVPVTNLHRPMIDELTRPNPDDPTGKSMMRRVPEVLDCWFESGSMPFAQVHYPFENKEWFDNHFPGDFIVEYIGQTRGWFYTLHILSTALFDRPAFKNCVSHGIVLGNDGAKMSKSLRNYPDVREVFERDGADAMRWFLMSSPILRGGNLVVTEQGIRDAVRTTMLPMWSSWYFFSLYANAANKGEGYDAIFDTSSTDPLDKYLLSLTHDVVTDVQAKLDSFDIAGACDDVRAYTDRLTNWYIRRTRERFWEEDAAAFNTLYTALETLARVTAPLLPLISEEMWRGLTGERSVHLQDWPDASALPSDPALVQAMQRTQDVCSTAVSVRKAKQLRVRLPLSSLTVVTEGAEQLGEMYENIVRDEVNVKSVTFCSPESETASAFSVTQKLTVNARAAGPRLGKQVQQVIKASKTGDWSVDGDQVTAGGIELQDGEYTLDTSVDAAQGDNIGVAMLPCGGFVVLNTEVTPELEMEGIARDVIRVVQQARKDAGLDVVDRISLTVTGNDLAWKAVVEHQGIIITETLADQFGMSPNLGDLAEGDGVTEAKVGDGSAIRVHLKKLG